MGRKLPLPVGLRVTQITEAELETLCRMPEAPAVERLKRIPRRIAIKDLGPEHRTPAQRRAAARDLMIMAAILQGYSERLIAEGLGVSRETVRRIADRARSGPPKD